MGQLVKQGYFGELYYAKARSFRRNGIPIWQSKDQLRLNFIQAGGGAFRDLGVHVLDASWWSLGTPKPVYALGAAGAKFGPRGLGYNGPTPAPEIVEQFDTDDYGTGLSSSTAGPVSKSRASGRLIGQMKSRLRYSVRMLEPKPAH